MRFKGQLIIWLNVSYLETSLIKHTIKCLFQYFLPINKGGAFSIKTPPYFLKDSDLLTPSQTLTGFRDSHLCIGLKSGSKH